MDGIVLWTWTPARVKSRYDCQLNTTASNSKEPCLPIKASAQRGSTLAVDVQVRNPKSDEKDAPKTFTFDQARLPYDSTHMQAADLQDVLPDPMLLTCSVPQPMACCPSCCCFMSL